MSKKMEEEYVRRKNEEFRIKMDGILDTMVEMRGKIPETSLNDEEQAMSYEQQGETDLAYYLRNIGEAEDEADLRTLYKLIVLGKLEVPVTYEDGDQTEVCGLQSDILRNKWLSGMDYCPQFPVLTHLSDILLASYHGNYSNLMSLIKGLNPKVLSRELKKRETFLKVCPTFHPIIGAKALLYDSDILGNTIRVYGQPELLHIKTLKKLIDLGAEVNAHDVAGYTPLHHCMTSTGNIATFEMAKLLLENGADVNAVNRFGATPLMEPVLDNKIEYIRLLMQNGANPYIGDVNGITPFEIGKKTPSILKLLKLAHRKIPAELRTVSKEVRDFMRCSVCKKECDVKCTGCFFEWYCSAECQKADWETHKRSCKARKAKYMKVEYYPSMESDPSGPKRNKMHSVVKVQAPLPDWIEDYNALMVYNKDRTVSGILVLDEVGAKLRKKVRGEGYAGGLTGYFYAVKKKGHLFINNRILPPEDW